MWHVAPYRELSGTALIRLPNLAYPCQLCGMCDAHYADTERRSNLQSLEALRSACRKRSSVFALNILGKKPPVSLFVIRKAFWKVRVGGNCCVSAELFPILFLHGSLGSAGNRAGCSCSRTAKSALPDTSLCVRTWWDGSAPQRDSSKNNYASWRFY